MPVANLFLSAVSAEFASYREALRRDLTRPHVSVAVQEDFVASGSETLDKLDDYLRACDGVIHLVGDMTGALAQPDSVAVIRQRYPDLLQRLPVLAPFLAEGGPGLSYAQWEAWLALYHRRRVVICAPQDGAPRDARYVLDALQQQAQQAHRARLAGVERFVEFQFADASRLAVEVLRSPLGDLVRGTSEGNSGAGAVAPRSLPSRPNAFFTGRAALLQSLEKLCSSPPGAVSGSAADAAKTGALSPLRCVVLSGLGGVGKTRLALEYAWAHAGTCAAVLFADASEPGALERALAEICRPGVLNLSEHQATDQAVRLAAVQRWLANHPGWLLVADNVDNEAAAVALEAALAPLAGGLVVITSRLAPERWGGGFGVLTVQELAPADASAFLLQRTLGLRRPAADDAQTAAQLALELGCLPLALEQAAAYVAQRRLTLAAYLAQWAGNRDQLLAWYDPRLMNYPRSVAATWQTSIQQLSAPALRLLARLAWLAPEPIPESLLEVSAGTQDSVQLEPWAALAELASLSLVRRDEIEARFTVHRLVQEVSRAGQPGSTSHAVLGETLAWLSAAFVGDPVDVRHWPGLQPLVPHVVLVVKAADAWPSDALTRLMNQLALYFIAHAQHAQAEPLLRRALAIDEARWGANHLGVATRLLNLGYLLRLTNRLVEAESLIRRALAINEAELGPEHPSVAIDLNNLSQLLRQTNQVKEAEQLIVRALAISRASLAPDDPALAVRISNLAGLYLDSHRLAEAEPLMRQALSIDEKSYGPEHPTVASDLSNLAALLLEQGDWVQAEPLMRRALRIGESAFGPLHPTVAVYLNNLARVVEASGQRVEAEALMRRALAIAETSLGSEHPHVATQLSNLARLLKAAQRLEDAEPMMRRALEIHQASLGPDHPTVATDLNNLARLLQDTGRLNEAELLMRRAAVVLWLGLGKAHPKTTSLLRNYLGLAKALGLDGQTAAQRLADDLGLRHSDAVADSGVGSDASLPP